VKFLLMVCVDESVEMSPEVREAHVNAAIAWGEEMSERGVRVLGDRLRPVSDATSLRRREGELYVSDGPFAETREQMAGFDVLECADLTEALEVAAKHPGAEIGTIELRPIWT
jgi:hypothetical protein